MNIKEWLTADPVFETDEEAAEFNRYLDEGRHPGKADAEFKEAAIRWFKDVMNSYPMMVPDYDAAGNVTGHTLRLIECHQPSPSSAPQPQETKGQ